MTNDNWLSRLMDQAGISQAELSKLSHLDEGLISRLRRDITKPTPETLQAIARALRLSVEFVYREAGLLPKLKGRDAWVERVEGKLEQITDEKDKETIEGLIDLLAPDKKVQRRSTAKNERAS